MRRLFVDLDQGKILVAPGTSQLLTSIDEKRSPNAGLEVQFLRNVTVQELSPGASGKFEIKESLKYDANTIAGAASWVKSGSGETTLYTFTYDSMVAALDALLGIEAPVVVTGVNTGTDTLTSAASPPIDARIQFQTVGTLPAGLFPNTDYWVITAGHTTTDFKVSLTQGGAVVDITSAGSGGTDNKWAKISDDIVSVTLMAEIQWIADGRTNKTQTFDYVHVNDVVRDSDTFVPPAAQDIVLNVRAGKQAITNGTDTGSVVFVTPFTVGANVCVVAAVVKPAGGDNVFATVKEDTVTVTGFDYDLSAEVPATGYKLNYLAVAV